MEQAPALAFHVIQGVALAACSGLRAFLPLLVVGAAARLEWIRLGEAFEWLSSTPALIVFGLAVVLEVAADKIPLLDHALDAVQFAIKPVAGTIIAASVMVELTPLQATVLAIVTGGTVADVVHLAKSKLRVASTALTAGAGNPVVSTAEDGGSLLGTLIAIFLPIVVIALLVPLLLLLWRRTRIGRRSGKPPGVPAGDGSSA
jgi:hypothetical protein